MERTHAFEQRVVGRERELAALAACVSGGTAPGGAVVVVGEPGIGKTTLWEAAVEMARAQGLRTLLARPTDAEARLAHGTLVDLFDGVAPHELAGLLPPQRRALEIALLRAEPDGRAPASGAVPVGLLNALRLLAARTPLVIGIDDLQSLDAQSAEALAFAARRLDSAPVRFVLARRPGTPGLLEAALATHGLDEGSSRADRAASIDTLIAARRRQAVAGGDPRPGKLPLSLRRSVRMISNRVSISIRPAMMPTTLPQTLHFGRLIPVLLFVAAALGAQAQTSPVVPDDVSTRSTFHCISLYWAQSDRGGCSVEFRPVVQPSGMRHRISGMIESPRRVW